MIHFTPESYNKQIVDNLCRWQEDGPTGTMICHDEKLKGKSYCEAHQKRAYKGIRKKARKTYEDI